MKIKISHIVAFISVSLVSINTLARDWSSYTSENFIIYSDIRPKDARELLNDFEIFRKVTFTVLGMQPKPSHSKLQILVYAKNREYKKIAPKNSIGFFSNTSAGPRMVVGSSVRSVISETEVLFHEYIHYLVREHSTLIYPRWYDEGLAEVLAATKIKKGKVTVGAISKGRALSVNHETPFKVRDLLSPDADKRDSRSYESRFYAYSWLFTHYLQISSLRDNGHLKPQFSDFISRYNQGEDSETAFELSFGITPEDMDKELKKYIRQRTTVLQLSINEFESEITEQALTKGEQSFLLADIAWRRGEEEIALDYLEDIDKNNSEFARSLSLAAVLENHKDEDIDAIAMASGLAKGSLELAPDDSQVLTNYAHWLSDTLTRLEKDNKDSGDLLSQQITYLEQAIKADATNMEAHRFLWRAQIKNEEPIAALRTMMAAYQLEPSNVGINNTVARHLLSQNRGDLARPFLERVMNWSHSSEQRQTIKGLLDKIDAEKEQQSSG